MSFLMKVAFQFVTKVDVLWVRVLRAKYRVNEICPTSIERQGCSYVWRSLSKIWSVFREQITWSVGNGDTVDLFHDDWIPPLGLLHSYVR